jgi:hypothetical protein
LWSCLSQVYGADGGGSAIYRHDFVERFNRSSGPVSLAGGAVEYGGSTETGAFANNGRRRAFGHLTAGPFLSREARDRYC